MYGCGEDTLCRLHMNARGEMVYALGLRSNGEIHVGSSPTVHKLFFDLLQESQKNI